MSNSYANKLLPNPVKILGLELKPFCLGHYILLSKCGCNFIGEGDVTVNVDDLIMGLLICTQSYEDGFAFVQQLQSFGKNSKINIEIDGEKFVWAALIEERLKREEGFNIFTHINAFANYVKIKNGETIPSYSYNDEGKGSGGGHWSQSILLVLTGDLGYTRTEALNMPIAQAFWDYFKHGENSGVLELADEEESERIMGVV